MPAFSSRDVAIALDMAGCPNRCRHCWLGKPINAKISEDTLRWVVKQFREYVKPGELKPFFGQLTVQSWYREPDFAHDYRRFWELENELSDPGRAVRFELASIWRLARDPNYVFWLKEIGTTAVQITFFGLEGTTDYFTRRPGAFRDNLVATERLLAKGIMPRWQLFLTTKAMPELPGFVELIDELNLEARAIEAGGEFAVFLNNPNPQGEAFNIEALRPSVDVLNHIPRYLLDKTIQHFDVSDIGAALGRAEAEWVRQLWDCPDPFADFPETLAFMITSTLDVYPNLGELTPSWRLGNLERDGISEILERYESDAVRGLQGMFHVPAGELARTFGRKESRLLYAQSDAIHRWLKLWEETCD